MDSAELHIPEGINYSCSGCGMCCHSITVPMTEEDYDRLLAIEWEPLIPNYDGRETFRPLRDYEKEGTAYTHAIKEDEKGHCPFLVNKLCAIHGKYDGETKPTICQLFPYSFNETPTGIFCTVSFRSTAVLYNQGTPLTEQRDVLEDRLAKFKYLYPGKKPNWDSPKLTTNQPMTWQEYLELEVDLFRFLDDKSIPLQDRLLNASDFLLSKLEVPHPKPEGEAGPLNRIDRQLLSYLHLIYFPHQLKFKRGENSFSVFKFIYRCCFAGSSIRVPGKSYSLDELRNYPWPAEEETIEDLLYRFFYSRIFGKWYFGGGFGQLSLITGLHHLIICLELVRLNAKAGAMARGSERVTFEDVTASVKKLEEQLSETQVNPYGAAAMELLMFSPRRLRRILATG